ncbi:Rgp1-domain-containing protein [Pseudovirgaria hyperparasitica]|uniref:Rgp1-domain-containing protein n=1 Tax=Pseudovirgaria hyperparasitica TaxID=470096 RepID=A0A6A6WGX9_9PEZI|nr:Rgp1-domain-containing protein [Pseudovirgaria hyperparasitica]KAF2762112.1 Rgp1-domain-containing protein [Pseudovirgaria hyperparasitica]
MSSNIRVFVQWKDATVFAGEDLECTITFKNVALLPQADRSPNRRQNGFLAAVERQQHRNPALRPSVKPSLSRNSSFGPQLPTQHAKGHRPTLSLSTSATTVPSISQFAGGANTPTSAGPHGRSLSIVSLGSGGNRDPDRASHSSPRRPTRPHGRSASLQVVPGKKTGSPHTGSHRAQSATQTPTVFSSAAPALTTPSRFSGAKRSGITHISSTGRRGSGSLTPHFKFPQGTVDNENETISEHPVGVYGRPPRVRGNSPRPADEMSATGETLSPVARLLSGTSMNGTPRSSGEFYSMSNHSSETLPSEYITQPMARLLPPSHSRRSSQAPQPRVGPESLMMGYAQVMGSFTLDGSLINQAPFEEVKRKGVLGGQGGGGVVGVERLKRDSGLFGALGWGTLGESLGGLLGTSEPSSMREMRGIANSKTVPLLTTPQSILFVDLRLAPGESRSYRYKFKLPRGLPPTHKGRAVKVAYHLAIGTQRPGMVNGQQQVRHVDIPFRVFGGVTGEGEILGHDLMSPYIILRDEAQTERIDVEVATPHQRKTPKPSPRIGSGSADFLDYVNNLLDKPDDNSTAGLLSPTAEDPRRKSIAEELPNTMKEIIDLAIMRCNNVASSSQSTSRFDIARSGYRVATINLGRPAYRLGETISVVIDFSNTDIPCYSVIFCLETAERVDPAIALRSHSSIYRATRKVHAVFSDNALYSQRLTFAPTIPPNATPDFVTSGVSLEWRLRIEFTTPRLTYEEVEEGAWTDVLEEVGNDDRGVILAAAEKLPCETFEVSVPIRIYGAVTGCVENVSEGGLVV